MPRGFRMRITGLVPVIRKGLRLAVHFTSSRNSQNPTALWVVLDEAKMRFVSPDELLYV